METQEVISTYSRNDARKSEYNGRNYLQRGRTLKYAPGEPGRQKGTKGGLERSRLKFSVRRQRRSSKLQTVQISREAASPLHKWDEISSIVDEEILECEFINNSQSGHFN